jgi:hypothetical protein
MKQTVDDGRSGRRKTQVALGLWLLLAIVVFNVRFDWQARVAAHRFVQAQVARQTRGEATLSINDGFRPMVRDAASEAALWLIAIAVAGGASVAAAARTSR